MKLSVSVPDGLWASTLAVGVSLDMDLSPSGLIQEALRYWTKTVMFTGVVFEPSVSFQ